MEIILFATAIITLAIFLIIFINLIKEIKTNSFNKKEIPLITLALSYLIFTTILILQLTNFLIFKSTDLLMIFAIILIIQTACIVAILYKTSQTKHTLYALSPFLFLIPLILAFPEYLHVAIPISLFVTLFVFLQSASMHESPTRYIIFYTSISLFLYLFAILWQNLTSTLILTSSAIFLAFIISFLKFLRLHTQLHLFPQTEPESPLIYFLKHFVFIIIITNFIFIGTISVHEFGHLAMSEYSNCQDAKIVYELKGLPHTEVECENTSTKNHWILGGVLLPFIVALFLFFGGGKFIKELALQIVGFNLIISYLDLLSLNISKAITTFALIFGITLTVFSLALLAKSRVDN